MIAEDNLPLTTFLVIVIVLSNVITWVLRTIISGQEIKKQKAEITTLIGDALQRSQDSSRKAVDASARCGRFAERYMKLIKDRQPVVEIDSMRTAFCECFSSEVVISFIHSFQHTSLYLMQNPDPDESLTEHVDAACEEFARFRKWLETINHPNALSNLGRQPLILQQRSFNEFIWDLRKFPINVRSEALRKGTRAVEDLIGLVKAEGE